MADPQAVLFGWKLMLRHQHQLVAFRRHKEDARYLEIALSRPESAGAFAGIRAAAQSPCAVVMCRNAASGSDSRRLHSAASCCNPRIVVTSFIASI